MSGAPFLLAQLEAKHDRTAFHSDSDPLNRYLREQATQDVRRRVAACFVALADGKRIAGYYTLASASLLLADLPASIGRKLPRYPTVPTVRMGRLAVDSAIALVKGETVPAEQLQPATLTTKDNVDQFQSDFQKKLAGG